MPLDLYLGFVAATLVLILIPGPNVALIVANSVAHDTRYGLVTVAGTSVALALQLALTVAGLSAMLALMAAWFELLRWLGVAYLAWLAFRAWRAPATDLAQTAPEPRAARAMILRGFLVALTNPKTLLFFGAFLPQFVSRDAAPLGQLVLLAATFLILAIAGDTVWAALAGRARVVLARGRWRNRVTGGLLMGAGVGLALARRP
ncbi:MULTISPECIES: LysE family translocator [Methylobacterium]|jgi:homoserine/homoserine lactone efflux protein|uniref:LysE family translocator n=1 Tax=Methylobacterium TaxID=407 RepID=UPI0008E0689D|nr:MULTISPECIES: LysE family translocator [Methylobacterium]MBZ6411373.1 LysE family translocator [Methylobacterium sp.]MBK3399452.1 LysE family translocator [Methylobacterium ajmalii]MBK3406995.1 LysE family translocator [Methylobacterium ajmalii]MBK3426171.1 LysE family translocator [Methylobacterium ajmalii]SFE56034.1 Threonine/homoserine/homoserine lactone efflux protein [Methylobacterium sp. yr596]